MPIRTHLLKKWVGPDPEKHIGSTPLGERTVFAAFQSQQIQWTALRHYSRLLRLYKVMNPHIS